MESFETLLSRLAETENGFKHIIEAGNQLLADPNVDHLKVAVSLLDDDRYSSRMLATHLLGELSCKNPAALSTLKERVARDGNWRVQEMLAKAFDAYCAKVGYENAMPTIQEWLSDEEPNVKRAVTEGLRIWTGRPYFKEHPEIAIQLIASVKNDDSEYLRKSVGNALRDIRKKHAELVDAAIASWDKDDDKLQLVIKLVTK